MQGSKDRILTTHIGSLPRTLPVLDAMKARFDGDTFDDKTYQAEIDIVTDG
jgi:methionine synthase II (cobalamin-independent)